MAVASRASARGVGKSEKLDSERIIALLQEVLSMLDAARASPDIGAQVQQVIERVKR
jgi:hypothetical protein